MEFGMFHQFPSLPGRTDAETFAEAFEQIVAFAEGKPLRLANPR